MMCHSRKIFAQRAGQACLALLVATGLIYSPAAVSVNNVVTPRVDLDVPFVPTPIEIVNQMLEVADVQPSDFLIDLGSGDGRIAIRAVRDRGARGALGVDLDPVRVQEARANADAAGVGDTVKFEVADLFETDFSKASVVSMYLLPEVNIRLRPKVLELAPGTRIVSHAFDMDEWQADQHIQVGHRNIYLWIVPAKVEGQWKVSEPEGEFTVQLQQRFQNLSGVAMMPDQQEARLEGHMRGSHIEFDMDDGTAIRRYVGTVHGDVMTVTPEKGAQKGWRADRL